jgi:hypothetical protein
MTKRERIRCSRELPDDAGRVFVTYVPGAPLQILGRRDPATGELCVGSVYFPPPGVPPPTDDLPGHIEIVTGPEAERLILAVHRRLTERAIEQGISVEELVKRLISFEELVERFIASSRTE